MKKILVFVLLFMQMAHAKELTQGEVVAVEEYLNSIKNAESDFVQLNPDGSLSEGRFYLKKPGKFRWEYDDQPIIIVANGKSLIYYDTELEQSNYVPIEQSIAALITRRKIKFTGDLQIVSSNKTKDSTKITAVKKEQKDVGEFTFVFTNKPFELKKVELVDSTGQAVEVSFLELKVNRAEISDSLFKIKDSRLR